MLQMIELIFVAQTAFAALLLCGALLGARNCRRHQRRVVESVRLPHVPRLAPLARPVKAAGAAGSPEELASR